MSTFSAHARLPNMANRCKQVPCRNRSCGQAHSSCCHLCRLAISIPHSPVNQLRIYPCALCPMPCCPQAHRSALSQLPCQVVAAVPRQEADEAAAAAGVDPRRHSPFIAYALIAAAEVRDALASAQSRHRNECQHSGVWLQIT